MDEARLGSILFHIQKFLSYCLRTSYGPETPIISAVLVLNLIYQANQPRKVLNYRRFYNEDVCKNLNLEQDFDKWQGSNASVFAFCRYPFLFTPGKSVSFSSSPPLLSLSPLFAFYAYLVSSECKARLLKIDAEKKMQLQMRVIPFHYSSISSFFKYLTQTCFLTGCIC
jgi:protoheme ferro-lyase